MDSKRRNPSAHALSAEGQQRRVVRERVTSVWLLSTVSDSFLSKTFASFWYVKGECLICGLHNSPFLSQSLNCFWCFKWEKRSVTPPSREEAKRGERNLPGVNQCVRFFFSWVYQYSASKFSSLQVACLTELDFVMSRLHLNPYTCRCDPHPSKGAGPYMLAVAGGVLQ